MADNKVIIKIQGKDDGAKKALNETAQAAKNLDKSLKAVAVSSGVAFAALAAGIGLAVRNFSAFESKFTDVVTLLDNRSFGDGAEDLARGIESLKEGVIRLGVETGDSFDSLNKGLFDLVSAGVPATQAIEQLEAATRLSIAGATNTATAVNALTAAFTAFGKEAGTAEEVAQKFFTAQKFGKTTVEELANEFNKVAGLGQTLGVTFDELLAAGSALTLNGAKPTTIAFTELRGALNAVLQAQKTLGDESPEVAKALSLSNIQAVGFAEALNQTKDALGGDITKLQELIPNIRGLSAVISLTGSQADDFTKIMNGMGNELERAGNFNTAFAVKQETTEKALARASRSIEAVSIAFGEKFAPVIVQVANTVGFLANKISELDDSTLSQIASVIKYATVFTGVTFAASTFGLGLIKLKGIIKALGISLKAGRRGWSLFWGSATIGLTLLITEFPTLLNFIDELTKKLKAPAPPSGKFDVINEDSITNLKEANEKLEELLKKRKEAASIPGGLGDFEVADIDRQLDDLDKVRRKLLENQRVVAEVAQQEKEIQETANKEKAALRAKEGRADRRHAADLADIRKRQLEISQEEQEGFSTRIIDIKKQEVSDLIKIDTLKSENEKIRAKASRSATEVETLSANQAQIEQLNEHLVALDETKAEAAQKDLEDSIAHAETKRELELEQQEIDDQIAEERRELDNELNAALNASDIEDLQAQGQTRQQILAERAKAEIEQQRAKNKQFILDEQQFGKEFAVINKAINSDEVDSAQKASDSLVQLTQSKNSTLKGIGKAAAVTDIAINTAKGAMAAFSAFQFIPFIGAALGAAAAAAVVAFGIERTANVLSAAGGGIVPGGMGGARDRIPALLEPGEAVVPASQTPSFIEQIGNTKVQDNQEEMAEDEDQANKGTSAPAGGSIVIDLTDEASQMITLKQREDSSLGV